MIGVLGKDPFGPVLGKMKVGGRRIAIRRYDTMPDRPPCQILFISSSASAHLETTLETMGQAGLLIVGDTRGYGERGVTVNFYLEKNRVKFEINPVAARRANLMISSKLLGLAKIVQADDRAA